MKISEMKNLVKEAMDDIKGAENQYGEVIVANSAQVSALVSIAKSLAVIAAAMVEKQIRAELREELEEMRQERRSRNYGYGGLDS